MKYLGSKNRLSKYIVPIIQDYINEEYPTYIEPFVGGANIIDKIQCKKKIGYDIHPYLIALLQKAQEDCSVFPNTLSQEEYEKVKKEPTKYPDWYVGLVGFCSWGGKWFGGYPRAFKNDKVTPRDMPNEIIRNLIKQAPNLKNIEFECKDFREINVSNCVIYCDPPYKETTKYDCSAFPYEEFYEWCKKMSLKNKVIISEYSMPDDFKCIYTHQTNCLLNKGKAALKQECLFTID